jgi:hypothetical protein
VSKKRKRPLRGPIRIWKDIRRDLKDIGCGMDSSGSGYVPVAGSCEQGNATSSFIKDGSFSERLSYCQLLKDNVP